MNGMQDSVSIQATAASCLQFVIGRESIEVSEALRSIQSWREKNNSRMIGEVESILQQLLVEISRASSNYSVDAISTAQSQPVQDNPQNIYTNSPTFASAVALCQLGRGAASQASHHEIRGHAFQAQAEQNQLSVQSTKRKSSPSYISLCSGSSTPVVIPHLLSGSLYSPSIPSLLPKAAQGTHERSGNSLEGLESIQEYLDNETAAALDGFSRMLNNSAGEYDTYSA